MDADPVADGTMVSVTADAIRSAHRRIRSGFRDSPQFISEPLSEEIGVPVVVKLETANPIGSFKGRGTWLAMSELMARGRVGERHGVVVASAGNFGQGVAYAARAMNVPVIVFAATSANPTKVAAMRRLGADVRAVGEDFDAARLAAADLAAGSGWHLLVDGEDPWISIGAGTIALELTDAASRGDLPALDRFYVPVGNGALVGGGWHLASIRGIGHAGHRGAGCRGTGHDAFMARTTPDRDAARRHDCGWDRRPGARSGGAGADDLGGRRDAAGRRRSDRGGDARDVCGAADHRRAGSRCRMGSRSGRRIASGADRPAGHGRRRRLDASSDGGRGLDAVPDYRAG